MDEPGFIVCTASGAPATGRYANIDEANDERLMLNTLDDGRHPAAGPFQVLELVDPHELGTLRGLREHLARKDRIRGEWDLAQLVDITHVPGGCSCEPEDGLTDYESGCTDGEPYLALVRYSGEFLVESHRVSDVAWRLDVDGDPIECPNCGRPLAGGDSICSNCLVPAR